MRRLVARRLREMDPAERARRDAVLIGRALDHPWIRDLPAGAVVFGYAPLPDEPDLGDLWRALLASGRRTAFPRWLSEAPEHDSRPLLTFHETRSPPPGFADPRAGAEWEKTLHAVWAPVAAMPEMPLSAAALVVVPGRAFAPGGWRLGRGLGCYDRWLVRLDSRTPTLAAAYDEQIFDEVPRAGCDHPLSAWFTPTRSWPEPCLWSFGLLSPKSRR